MTENSSFYDRKYKFLGQKTQVFITENSSFYDIKYEFL